MQQDELIGYSLLGLVVWSLILSAIINSSTNANKLLTHAKAQTLLLAELAKKAGADPEEVKAIIDKAIK